MSNYLTDFIKQPTDQIVYNTFYYQKLLEVQDFAAGIDIPDIQYLSQTVNRNLKSIAVGDYYKFVTSNTFENITNKINIQLQFPAYDNCLLSGFEVGIDNISGSTITFKVYPGLAIIDTFLLELREFILFDFDTSVNLDNDNFIIVLDYIGKGGGAFSIRYYMLDDHLNPIINDDVLPWRASYLPLSFFRINRDTHTYILALESLGVPFELMNGDLVGENKIYDADASLMYQFADIEYIDTIKNKTVLGTKSLIPLYIPPKHYIIAGIDYIIPNYGKQVNTGYELANMLDIDKSPLAKADLNIPILKPTNNNLYNSIFTVEMFSNFDF